MIKIGYNHGTVIDPIHQAVILGGCVTAVDSGDPEPQTSVPVRTEEEGWRTDEEGLRTENREWQMLPILLYQGHTMAEVRRTNEIIGIMCHRSAPELMAKLVQLDNEERILLDGIGAKELHDMLLSTYPTMTVSYNAFREAFRLAG